MAVNRHTGGHTGEHTGLPRPAALVVAACALVAIAAYLVVAVLRISYPFELQWIESASVEAVRRLRAGDPIYAAPSVEWVPLPYPPLYFLLGTATSYVLGIGFTALRVVSMVASVACGVALFGLVRREVGGWLPGLVSVGLYAASFGVTGAWFDIARVDSLFLALVLGSTHLARGAEASGSRRAAAAGGAVLGLACLTKQAAFIVALPVVAWMVLRNRRLGVAMAAGAAAPVALVTVLGEVLTGGWYRYFVFQALGRHPVEGRFLTDFLTADLFPHAWVALAGVGAALWFTRRRPPGLLVALAGGLVAASWIGRLHSGGYVNNLMPAYAAIALAAGLAVGWCANAAPGRGRRVASWVVPAAAAAQLALLAWSPVAEVPTAADEAAGRAFVEAVAALDGDVWVVSHPTYAVMAGKPSYAHGAAVGDILRGDDEELKSDLRGALRAAIGTGRWGAIVLDGGPTLDGRGVEEHLEGPYAPVEDPVFGDGDGKALRPVADLQTRPTIWYSLRQAMPRTGDPY